MWSAFGSDTHLSAQVQARASEGFGVFDATLRFLTGRITEAGILAEPEISSAVCSALARFADAISRE